MQKDPTLKYTASVKNLSQIIRLIDSRGKQVRSTKISLCLNKCGNSQNQPPLSEVKSQKPAVKKGFDRITINKSNTLARSVKPIIKIESKKQIDTKSISIDGQKHLRSASVFDSTVNQSKGQDQSIFIQVRQYIESVKTYYEAKIQEVLEDNLRAISELRSLLMHQQQQIAEKQQRINQLLAANRFRPERIYCHLQSDQNGAQIEKQSFLSSKIELLQTTTSTFNGKLSESVEQIADKMQRLQIEFFSHFSTKITKLRLHLEHNVLHLENKCIGLEAVIEHLRTKILNVSQYQDHTDQLNQRIKSLSHQIKNMNTTLAGLLPRQFEYKSDKITILQAYLMSLIQKIEKVQRKSCMKSTIKQNEYFLEDDDQFFYPSSQRNSFGKFDQYEHFESDSSEGKSSSNKYQACPVSQQQNQK